MDSWWQESVCVECRYHLHNNILVCEGCQSSVHGLEPHWTESQKPAPPQVRLVHHGLQAITCGNFTAQNEMLSRCRLEPVD